MKTKKLPKHIMTKTFFQNHWKSDALGFFLEIGACDGIKSNSTKILEDVGWQGVCIEANPDIFEILKNNRSANCLNLALYNSTGYTDFAIFPDQPEWSGIIETFDNLHLSLLNSEEPRIKNKVSRKAVIKKIKTATWNNLNLPTNIDYCQIDVEGAELKILETIDWDNTNITYICIEDWGYLEKNLSYNKFLLSKNYKLIDQNHSDFLYKLTCNNLK